MTPPDDDFDPIPLDRWAVPLNEPDAPPIPPPPAAAVDDAPPDLLRFPLDADAPAEGFHPRLIRFGKAG